ncbi:hypothetical protein CBR_g46179 [Chara braunii]|uniref:Uncharacterized protein n=1 Tax=Chara braunii TaxID=69332 RepID=A0A388M073_CHABU|nr:hypothetical protein CBR_g46179 [Chara braunii]|eukprot:GBG87879.1 hypothetical protein CBR_g46179 [Chara braunii]
MRECRENLGRSDLAKQLEDLRTEVASLCKRNEEMEEVAQLWRSEALRPGNKRDSINVATPTSEGRVSTQSKVMSASEESRRLRAELLDLHERRKCDLSEVDLLKKKRAEAEIKRVEAEIELQRLKDETSKLTNELGGSNTPKTMGTNLKERMEEAARSGFHSSRKTKMKATPGRALPGSEQKANDKFAFLLNERKRLKGLKKMGLEAICQEEGV